MTTLSCYPNPDQQGHATICTALVTSRYGNSIPSGEVLFVFSSGYYNFHFAFGSCYADNSINALICKVTYTPTFVGKLTVYAYYFGDSTHEASYGSTVLHVDRSLSTYSLKDFGSIPGLLSAISIVANSFPNLVATIGLASIIASIVGIVSLFSGKLRFLK